MYNFYTALSMNSISLDGVSDGSEEVTEKGTRVQQYMAYFQYCSWLRDI